MRNSGSQPEPELPNVNVKPTNPNAQVLDISIGSNKSDANFRSVVVEAAIERPSNSEERFLCSKDDEIEFDSESSENGSITQEDAVSAVTQ
jgi:hypothetical protein